jgi:16S rRNA (uracil1498-N3)-methyltransferase|tara:strand:- start:519 stop:1244 length:726 start_codon:yes stop_codon:yes gene_type:complete
MKISLTRNFVDQHFAVNKKIILEKSSTHHLLKVLRKKEGDEIILFDGKGNSCLGVISSLNKSQLELEIIELFDKTLRSGIKISLGQSLIKSDPLNFIIQKATELGVASFYPLITDRSVIKLKMTKNRALKWSLIARGACEQCGENWLPIIESPMKLDKWAEVEKSKIKIVLYPHANNKISDLDYKDSVSLAIGPEGDFTEYEVDSLIEKGFIPVTIGQRILRAETAAISAISSVRFGAKEF